MSTSGQLITIEESTAKGRHVYVYEFKHSELGRQGTTFTFEVAVTREASGSFSAALRLDKAEERLVDGKKVPLASVEDALLLLGEWCSRASEALLKTSPTESVPLKFSGRGEAE